MFSRGSSFPLRVRVHNRLPPISENDLAPYSEQTTPATSTDRCTCGASQELGYGCTLVRSYIEATRALQRRTEHLKRCDTQGQFLLQDEDYQAADQHAGRRHSMLNEELARHRQTPQHSLVSLLESTRYKEAAKECHEQYRHNQMEDLTRELYSSAIHATKVVGAFLTAEHRQANQSQGASEWPKSHSLGERGDGRSPLRVSYYEDLHDPRLIPNIPPITLHPESTEFRTSYLDALRSARHAYSNLSKHEAMLESFAPSLCLNGTPRQLRTLWHSMWDPVATVKTEIASHLPADGLGSDESVSIMRGPLEVGTEPYTFSSLSDAITITVQSPSDGGDASGHDTPRAFVADTGYSVEDIRATGSGYE